MTSIHSNEAASTMCIESSELIRRTTGYVRSSLHRPLSRAQHDTLENSLP
ncbi:MAG TPA: hypothetical protein VM939_07040 [Gemmatimonadaceae bacterium]|nr:hypothetical protein [Gemmatimonadaceae bacterium]